MDLESIWTQSHFARAWKKLVHLEVIADFNLIKNAKEGLLVTNFLIK